MLLSFLFLFYFFISVLVLVILGQFRVLKTEKINWKKAEIIKNIKWERYFN